jgi:hypothetical protein
MDAPSGFESLDPASTLAESRASPGDRRGTEDGLTAQDIPGEPLNVGLIGGEHAVVCSKLAVGWGPADPITLNCRERTKTVVPILTNASST